MYELKKNGKVFTSKFVGTGPSSYEKRIYRAAVSQWLRNTVLLNGKQSLMFQDITVPSHLHGPVIQKIKRTCLTIR